MEVEKGLKYKERFLRLAQEVASWSSCPKGRQHGCVLAVDGKYICSTGYNGLSSNEYCIHKSKCKVICPKSICPAIHAEVNAIINAARLGVKLSDCVAYCTKKPCENCKRVLTNAGITNIHWLQG